SSPLLDQAIDVARQVAPTEISALINGESGVGKEVFPKIIHQLSPRKHGPYIAVNCGAIPEGTIDSELFGHEKGSFTGAHEARKGYFEVVNGGTIFLDEVSELPLSTQVRLLRILESGEFIKVGASKVLKSDVRVVAATNVDLNEFIQRGKFRQDLFYRLNTVPIYIPPLRARKEDILLLFRKFASDFSEKYRMPTLELDDEAQHILVNYRWYGNIRQLKNIAEQISIIEKNRVIDAKTLLKYLPEGVHRDLPMLITKDTSQGEFSERELLYKVLFDMRKDINDLKKLVYNVIQDPNASDIWANDKSQFVGQKYNEPKSDTAGLGSVSIQHVYDVHDELVQESEILEESLSLEKREIEYIRKALEKHNGKRKNAASELGISERTLYRKINEYGIDL
ncbi:MAG: sigma-54 dependent transcriptional regulator, partial [Bacteroidales bacterium]|nr:sigma-54 dependent transcriptional regulator [Bacteroidales bacterium]